MRLALAGRVREAQVVSQAVRRAQGAGVGAAGASADVVAAPGAALHGAADRRGVRGCLDQQPRRDPEQVRFEVDVQVGAMLLLEPRHLVRSGLPEQVHLHLARPHHPHPHVRAAVGVDRAGDRHHVLDAGVGILVLGCAEAAVVEGEDVDGGGAGGVRRVRGRGAGQAFVDVAGAVAVGVGEDVDEVDAVRACVRDGPEGEGLRPVPGAVVFGGTGRVRDALPEGDADGAGGGRAVEGQGALLPELGGQGREGLEGGGGGFGLGGWGLAFPLLYVGPGQAEGAALGGAEAPHAERQGQLAWGAGLAGRPLGAAGAVEHDVPGVSGHGGQGERGQ